MVKKLKVVLWGYLFCDSFLTINNTKTKLILRFIYSISWYLFVDVLMFFSCRGHQPFFAINHFSGWSENRNTFYDQFCHNWIRMQQFTWIGHISCYLHQMLLISLTIKCLCRFSSVLQLYSPYRLLYRNYSSNIMQVIHIVHRSIGRRIASSCYKNGQKEKKRNY